MADGPSRDPKGRSYKGGGGGGGGVIKRPMRRGTNERAV